MGAFRELSASFVDPLVRMSEARREVLRQPTMGNSSCLEPGHIGPGAMHKTLSHQHWDETQFRRPGLGTRGVFGKLVRIFYLHFPLMFRRER